MKSLCEFPRVHLVHRPTPLEAMPNATRLLGGPSLYVKRDDCTGLAMGGNKARQLEFYLGEAVARGATTVVITGAVQSNYVRCAAAAAAKLGLKCEMRLEDRVKGMGAEYQGSGNVLLDGLLGATVHSHPESEDDVAADRALEEIAARLRSEGERPYVIHLSEGYPPLGALGYVEAAQELLDQAARLDLSGGSVVLASGSAATHAGLLVGLRANGRSDIKVYGICVRRGQEAQAQRVLRCASQTAELLGCAGVVSQQDVIVTDDYLGPGYGRPTSETMDAILFAARTEGLLLDPVYTGKAFAGLIGLARRGVLDSKSAVIFLHTGGTPALFGYGSVLVRHAHGAGALLATTPSTDPSMSDS